MEANQALEAYVSRLADALNVKPECWHTGGGCYAVRVVLRDAQYEYEINLTDGTEGYPLVAETTVGICRNAGRDGVYVDDDGDTHTLCAGDFIANEGDLTEGTIDDAIARIRAFRTSKGL